MRRCPFRLIIPRHAFHARANAHIYPTYGDTIGDGRDGLEARCAGTIDGVQRCARWVADVVQCHTGGFGTAELGKDGPDCDILDGGGWNTGESVERGTEDLAICKLEAQGDQGG